MSITRRTYLREALSLAALLLAGCDSSTGPDSGSLEIRVTSHGGTLDLDANGYTLRVDDAPPVAISNYGTVTIPDLPLGTHVVRLDDLRDNCSVAGGNERSVELTGDGDPLVVSVVFTVNCAQRVGTVQVTAATTGLDLDADGYFLTISGLNFGSLQPNATRDLAGVREGQIAVTLNGIAANCTVDGLNPRIVNVVYGQTVQVAFAVRCVGTGGVLVTAVTSGVELDVNGYHITLTRQEGLVTRGFHVPSQGTATISGLLPGAYTVTVFDLAPNCDQLAANPRTFSVTSGGVATLMLGIECVAAPELVFVNEVNGNRDIYRVKTNGSASARLTDATAQDVDPAWSPDGSRIAFASNRDGNNEIYVMNADGSGQTRLTNSPAADSRPAWRPDGGRIAFVSQRDGDAEIYTMNTDGSNPVRLTTNAGFDGGPAWSPDGSRIAFESSRAGASDIYVMNADGSGVTRLTTNTRGKQPAWSPDGTRIAFVATTFSNQDRFDIYTVDANGGGITRLTFFEAALSDPSWSPDGRKLAFASPDCYYYYYECGSAIQIIGIDGTFYSVTTHPAAYDPAWKP